MIEALDCCPFSQALDQSGDDVARDFLTDLRLGLFEAGLDLVRLSSTLIT